jgi:hypothetical protein
MRGFLGVLAGLAAAIATAMLISFAGGFLVPAPASVDISTTESIRSAYSSLGREAQLLGIVSWALGALVGALVAKRIAGRPWAAWTVAAIVTLYQLASVLLLPMPGWMQVLALVLPIVAGFLANHLVATREIVEPDAVAETEADAEI